MTKLREFIVDLIRWIFLYLVGVGIIIGSLIIFNWYRIVPNASSDVVIFWQGIGISAAVYGFAFIFNRVLLPAAGIDKDKKNRELQLEMLTYLKRVDAQNEQILAELQKQHSLP